MSSALRRMASKKTRRPILMTVFILPPFLVFAVAFIGLWLAAWSGAVLRRKHRPKDESRSDLSLIVAATLTLLGLLIGFSFSMATGRYDQRKNFEEAEANAIGTEFVRADLLPTPEREKVRELLKAYADLRVRFYLSSEHEVGTIDAETTRVQGEMWALVAAAGKAQPNPVMALVVAGMNDVINSQGYTQAAWWNRIPLSAGLLMAAIAVCCNVLVGYSAVSTLPRSPLLSVLPFFVAIAFMLIADIDTPRRGLIQVVPKNLVAVTRSLQ